MKITVEISLYPCSKDYEDRVKAFIRNLEDHDRLEVLSNRMSTYIKGDIDDVFPTLQQELKEIYTQDTHNAFVMKVIPQELPMEIGYIDYSKNSD